MRLRCSRLAQGDVAPESAAQGSSRHAAGKPRAHTAPDLATDTLLKIAVSREAGELHLLRWGADRELRLSSHGAGVRGAEVHRADPSVVQLQECLEPPAEEDAAIPVPARCRGQEDTGREMRCSRGWDGPNPLGN